MESLVMIMFNNIYKGKNVLITGHNGFKGSWLSLWLDRLGSNVTGASLPAGPETIHWPMLDVNIDEHFIDIRDSHETYNLIRDSQPEIVFHLAAQALVRKSYADPLYTWSTNVMGTANVIDACRKVDSVKAIVVVTSDKCYENQEWMWGYREIDRLGGHDPYSASKAAAELVVKSYSRSYPDSGLSLATARAGNVIGGGDWSEDRLIPDVIRSIMNGTALTVRYPQAIRPWQHVLESLSGYLQLGQALIKDGNTFAEAWNFGPPDSNTRTVENVLNEIKERWDSFSWEAQSESTFHEAGLLMLDSSKARNRLSWKPVWSWQKSVENTVEWYRHYLAENIAISSNQLDSYISDAEKNGCVWAEK